MFVFYIIGNYNVGAEGFELVAGTKDKYCYPQDFKKGDPMLNICFCTTDKCNFNSAVSLKLSLALVLSLILIAL